MQRGGRSFPAWAALALSAVTASCKPAPTVIGDVPADVEWIAAIELDESGALLGATPLVHWAEGSELPIVAGEAARTILVGWSSSALGVDDAWFDAGAAPLTLATACAPSLPTASWAADWAGERAANVDPRSIPRLGAAWLDDLCPETSAADLTLDLRCRSAFCERRVTKTGRCTFDVDLSDCRLGVLPARVEKSGGVCLDLDAIGWSCERREGDTSSNGPYTCGRPAECAVDAYLGNATRAPPFDLQRVAIIPNAKPYLPKDWERRGPLTPQRVHAGHLYDLAVTGDRVVVSAIAGEATEACDLASGAPTELRLLDLESLETVATVAPALCQTELLGLPDRGDFVSTALDAGVWWVSRYDRLGTRVRTASVALPMTGADRWVVERMARLDRGRIAILFGGVDAFVGPAAVVTVHDETSLAELDRFEILDVKRSWIMRGDGHRALIVSHDSRGVGWLDVDARAFTLEAILEYDVPQLDALLSGVWHERSRRIVVAGAGLSALSTVDEHRDVTTHAVYDDARALLGLADWPLDDRLIMATGTLNRGLGDIVATATFFDVDALRFLPGTFPLGYGAAPRIDRDHAGRLWVLLPWAGELLRLTPKRP